MKRWLTVFCAGVLAASCAPKEQVPAAPDYASDASWYVTDRGGAIDLFYVCSTETSDYEVNGRVMHHASAADSAACPGIRQEMQGVDRILGGDLNFISPFYRQVTMETYADSTLIARRFPLAMGDVRRAFQYYVDHLSGGRPFVLAGFSQGGEALVELLKEMPEELRPRLVAAYVLGWKITGDDLTEAPWIRPARGADDTGVTICYNSVETPEAANPLVSEGNSVAINPVNWVTDATPAVLFDTLTVTLDPASKLLMVDGYEGDSSWLPYLRDCCYHTFEIRCYGDHLRENIAQRCAAYLGQ